MKHFRPFSLIEPMPYGNSYRASLFRVTFYGTLITGAFFLTFIIVYSTSNYPREAVWVNAVCLLCAMVGHILIARYKLHRLTAHLVTFATYFSSTGVMLVSGGIGSSSVIWLVFVPVAASMMAGLRAGLIWGGISLGTVITFFGLEQVGVLAGMGGFTTTHFDLLTDLSGAIIAVSIAIWFSDTMKSNSLTRLEETETRLQFLATTDPLTNVFNRRHFFEKSQRELSTTKLGGNEVAFLLFDIDHFKNINDLYGHQVGDLVLQQIAQTCAQNLRSEDILGRYGGEEFVILLPGTNKEKAVAVASRLCSMIGQSPIVTEAGEITVTISIGISMMDTSNPTSIDMLLSRADKAMYSAKKAGRNQIFIWDDRNPPETF